MDCAPDNLSNLDPTKWKARKGEERDRGLGMVAGLMQPTSTGIALQKNRSLINIFRSFIWKRTLSNHWRPAAPLPLLPIEIIGIPLRSGLETMDSFPDSDPSNLDPTKWKARKGEERNRGLGMVAGLMQPTSTGIALQKTDY